MVSGREGVGITRMDRGQFLRDLCLACDSNGERRKGLRIPTGTRDAE